MICSPRLVRPPAPLLSGNCQETYNQPKCVQESSASPFQKSPDIQSRRIPSLTFVLLPFPPLILCLTPSCVTAPTPASGIFTPNPNDADRHAAVLPTPVFRHFFTTLPSPSLSASHSSTSICSGKDKGSASFSLPSTVRWRLAGGCCCCCWWT